jgi:hypothetical protein
MRRIVLCLCCLIWLSISTVAAAQDTSDPLLNAPRGIVTGHITNGTAASNMPSDLAVKLVITDQGNVRQTFDTTVEADGRFSFSDVPIAAAYEYGTGVTYRERVFSSAFVRGDPSNLTLDLPIAIYELTEDPAVLTVVETVAQITALGDRMEIRQLWRFKNAADRAYTTSRRTGDGRYASVVIGLPPGAQVLSFDTPNRYIISSVDWTVADTTPVLPGDSHQNVLVYLLPYDGSLALIEQPFYYTFDGQARFLFWPDTLSIQSNQLAPQSSEALGERQYKVFSNALQLYSGQIIRYELSGASAATPSTPQDSANDGTGLLIAAGIMLFGLLIVGAALLGRSRQTTPSTGQRIDELIRQLDHLDNQHSRGQLAHDLWHRQRAPLLARLNELRGEEEGR